MMSVSRSRVAATLTLLGGALLLSACTGSDEDVRVTFCKSLLIAQLSAPDDVEWEDTKQQIQRPEYAAITVQVEDGATATCWFEYDAIEETAESHVDPLTAYSTLPYQMSVNGQQLADRVLLDAVNAEQRRLGRAALEQLRQAAYR